VDPRATRAAGSSDGGIMSGKTTLIRCAGCGQEAFLKRTPKYDGLRKVGEELRCSACGRVYESEADVPFVAIRSPAIFDASDAPRPIRVFEKDEKGRCCRYCANYVVNPFTQRCALHRREVEATDTCPEFTPKPEPTDSPPP
jgi:hypothetical protein